MKRFDLFFGFLRVPLDFVAGVLAFFVAEKIRLHPTLLSNFQTPAVSFPEPENYFYFALIASAGLVFIFTLNRMYELQRVSFFGEVRRVIFFVSAWIMFVTTYFFLTRELFFSRLVIVYAWLLAILFLTTNRVLIRGVQRILLLYGIGKRRTLIIGANQHTLRLLTALAYDPRYTLVGALVEGELNGDLKNLGRIKDFAKIAEKMRAEELILTNSELTHEQIQKILAYAREHHLTFRFIPNLYEVPQNNVDITTLGGIPLLTLRPTPLSGWGRIAKRIFDLSVSIFALGITSPIWLATALVIKFDSPGPVFFTEKDDGTPVLRVGRHGKLFRFIKFRSMRTKSDSLRYELKSHRAGPLVKIQNDPRVTRVGKFIRRYSIDELPQLISVIKGDMSLVGPRPHLPEEVAKYASHENRVLAIKPGITGLPQVSGRSELSFAKEIELDTWYIEHWSLWLDLKILLRTIGVVLFPKHKE